VTLKILVACEFSQIVTQAFRERGYEAYSCDILPTEGNPAWHIQGDVLGYLHDGWDMMIAFPPCTYLCNSGVRWLKTEAERVPKMIEACRFFNDLLNAPIHKVAIENPIQHRYARQFIRRPDQIVQPFHFGDRQSKATCLWLKNLPPLLATFSGGEGIRQDCFRTAPSPDRGKNRSRTFPGIAMAMVSQWGQE
jgi:hypothetical protein